MEATSIDSTKYHVKAVEAKCVRFAGLVLPPSKYLFYLFLSVLQGLLFSRTVLLGHVTDGKKEISLKVSSYWLFILEVGRIWKV